MLGSFALWKAAVAQIPGEAAFTVPGFAAHATDASRGICRRRNARMLTPAAESAFFLLAAQIFHAQLLQIFAVFYFDLGKKRFFEFGN
jgi:hypothetical protein